MAYTIPSFDWSKVSKNNDTPRRRYYPWDDWLNGQIWVLSGDGEDFDGPPISMEKVIRSTATARGVKVRIRVTTEAALVPDEDDEESRTVVVIQRHADTARASGKTRSVRPAMARLDAAR